MPPNRFESEVESFLEGSHGDRTHIKRADHPRLHHYAGRYFGRFHSIGLQFDDYTATGRGLTATNWGNRTIRTATRRLHADRQLLMLPNPHRCRCGGCQENQQAWLRRPAVGNDATTGKSRT